MAKPRKTKSGVPVDSSRRKPAGPSKVKPKGKSAEELAILGEQLHEDGDFPNARKQLEASLKLEQNPDVMFTLANCLLELNEPHKAKEHLERSCSLEPNANPDKWLSLAELQHGKDSLQSRQKAIELLEQELRDPAAMEADEDEENCEKERLRKLSNAYVSISELYSTDLRDEAEAEEMMVSSIRKALEVDSLNPEAYQAKAAYHLIKEDFDDAKQNIKKSLEIWLPTFEEVVAGAEELIYLLPPFNARLTCARLLLDLEMMDEASNVLDGLALEDEESVDVWYLLGWTNYLQGAEYHGNAKFYLRKAKKVVADYGCDDQDMEEHIDELLASLQDVTTDDEDEHDDDWETDDDED